MEPRDLSYLENRVEGNGAGRWDALRIPGLDTVSAVYRSNSSIAMAVKSEPAFPLQWHMQVAYTRTSKPHNSEFEKQKYGAIEATYCSGARVSAFSLLLEHPTDPAVPLSHWVEYPSVTTTRQLLARENATEGLPAFGKGSYTRHKARENATEGLPAFGKETIPIVLDGVYQSDEAVVNGAAMVMTMTGSYKERFGTRVPGSGLRYACIDELLTSAIFFNMLDAITVAPASQLPSCSTFPIFTEEPDKFQVEHILWASQSQYYEACSQLINDETAQAILESTSMAMSTSDIMTGYLKCAPMFGQEDYVIHALAAFSESNNGFMTFIDFLNDDFVAYVEYLKFALLEHLPWAIASTSELEFIFTTFNPPLNVLTKTTVLVQFDTVGNMDSSVDMVTFPMEFWNSFGGGWGIFFSIMCMIFVCGSIVSEIGESIAGGFSGYFSDGYNSLDVCRILLFSVTFCFELNYAFACQAIGDVFDDQKTLSQAAMADEVSGRIGTALAMSEAIRLLQSVNLLLHVIWILKYFRHPRLAVIRDTIVAAVNELGHFLIVFLTVYMIFVVMANRLYGQKIEAYSTLTRTFTSLFLILLGDFDYDILLETSTLGTVVFFWAYIFLCFFVLFNIILGIVVSTYDRIAETNDSQDTVWGEMIRVFLRRFEGCHERFLSTPAPTATSRSSQWNQGSNVPDEPWAEEHPGPSIPLHSTGGGQPEAPLRRDHPSDDDVTWSDVRPPKRQLRCKVAGTPCGEAGAVADPGAKPYLSMDLTDEASLAERNDVEVYLSGPQDNTKEDAVFVVAL